MKGRLAVLDTLRDGRRAAALIEDGRLADMLVDPPEAWGLAQPGAIFRARAGRPMKGQGGLFVDLGDGRTGFLRETKGIAEGAKLTVQVSTVPERGKASPVTRRILLRSRHAIATPGAPGVNVSRRIRDEAARDALVMLGREIMADAPAEHGLILRAAAAAAESDVVAEDAREMRDLGVRIAAEDGPPELLLAAPDAHLAAWRDWQVDAVDADPGAFARHEVLLAVRDAIAPRQTLSPGAMTVEPTAALVAVDVDTGGDASPAAGLKANVAAFRALPRALRLRGLGGQITVDPAPFAKRERTRLEQVMQAAIRADGGEITVAGWTPLGHLELQRKRDRAPLTELMSDVLSDL